MLISMPSPYAGKEDLKDTKRLATNLGAELVAMLAEKEGKPSTIHVLETHRPFGGLAAFCLEGHTTFQGQSPLRAFAAC